LRQHLFNKTKIPLKELKITLDQCEMEHVISERLKLKETLQAPLAHSAKTLERTTNKVQNVLRGN